MSTRGAPSGTRLRIENLHYDITETDLEVRWDTMNI